MWRWSIFRRASTKAKALSEHKTSACKPKQRQRPRPFSWQTGAETACTRSVKTDAPQQQQPQRRIYPGMRSPLVAAQQLPVSSTYRIPLGMTRSDFALEHLFAQNRPLLFMQDNVTQKAQRGPDHRPNSLMPAILPHEQEWEPMWHTPEKHWAPGVRTYLMKTIPGVAPEAPKSTKLRRPLSPKVKEFAEYLVNHRLEQHQRGVLKAPSNIIPMDASQLAAFQFQTDAQSMAGQFLDDMGDRIRGFVKPRHSLLDMFDRAMGGARGGEVDLLDRKETDAIQEMVNQEGEDLSLENSMDNVALQNLKESLIGLPIKLEISSTRQGPSGHTKSELRSKAETKIKTRVNLKDRSIDLISTLKRRRLKMKKHKRKKWLARNHTMLKKQGKIQ